MIGKTLKERYQLLKEIGRGAISTVYMAHDLPTGEVWAVKVLNPALTVDPDFERRFRREAKILDDILQESPTPHIVRIRDFLAEEDQYCIVMEYVEGKTIAQIVKERHALPIPQALEMAKQVAQGLEVTSRHSVVHRDIKPQNLLVRAADNVVKITDFGIARSIQGGDLTATRFLGTPHYVSPEQADFRVQELDIRSDLYSLGVVLFEMLTGRLLFEGDSPLKIAMMHVQEPAPKLSTFRPEVPGAVEHTVSRLLEKRREERYQTPRELVQAIDQVLPALEAYPTPPAPQPSQPAFLEIGGRRLSLNNKRNRVGRTDAEQRIFPDVDLTPFDPGRTTHRRHLVIAQERGRWVLWLEPGATVPTFVGDRQVLARDRIPRKEGDRIRRGKVTMVLGLQREET